MKKQKTLLIKKKYFKEELKTMKKFKIIIMYYVNR